MISYKFRDQGCASIYLFDTDAFGNGTSDVIRRNLYVSAVERVLVTKQQALGGGVDALPTLDLARCLEEEFQECENSHAAHLEVAEIRILRAGKPQSRRMEGQPERVHQQRAGLCVRESCSERSDGLARLKEICEANCSAAAAYTVGWTARARRFWPELAPARHHQYVSYGITCANSSGLP